MKRKIIIVSTLLTIIALSIFTIYKNTFSSEVSKYIFENTKTIKMTKNELQKLLVRTSYAFYYSKEYIKYNDGILFENENNKYLYRDLTVTPEELNNNKTVYMDNLSFVYSVYLNALNMRLDDESENQTNIETGEGFDADSIREILNLKDDRNVFNSEGVTVEQQSIFIDMYLEKIEKGDIIVYETTDEKIYLALYLGEGNCIYLYNNDDNMYDLVISNVKDYLFNENSFKSNVKYYGLLRPINKIEFNWDNTTEVNVPINSLARIDNVYIKRYTNINTYNVYPGEVIEYTIEVINKNNELVNISNITDIIDNKLIFISSEDGIHETSTKKIEWNNININANETKKFTYKVKVAGEYETDSSENSVFGKKIISNNAQILFGEDKYLILNKIEYIINNKYIKEQKDVLNNNIDKINKLNSYISYGIDEKSYKVNINEINNNNRIKLDEYSFIKFLYYNSFNIDLNELFENDNLLNSLYTLEENDCYVRNRVDQENEFSIKTNNMVVGNLYGGTKLNDVNRTKIFNQIVDKKNIYNNLVSGDILVYWDESNTLKTYLYIEKLENETYQPLLVRYYDFGINIISGTKIDEIVNKLKNESKLYVVLRPSMVHDIALEDITIDNINIKEGTTKEITFTKKPINATINSINYSSSAKYEITNNIIKGKEAGYDTLTITINEKIEKNVNVLVRKKILDFQLITDYQKIETNESKIIYVESDISVENILSKISFNENGYDMKIYNLNGQEVTKNITEKSILEISLDGEIVEQYYLISFTLNDDSNPVIVSNENIIKFINDGTKVSELLEILNFNGNIVNAYITDVNNNKLSNENALSTGDYLILNITDNFECKYQLSVLGDASGGRGFTANDVVLTRRHIVGWINPDTNELSEAKGVYLYAMDYTKNGEVTGNDVVAMRRKLVG